MRVGCWAFVVFGLVACGGVLPPLPSQGGPAWLEIESEHVTVWTDAAAERGQQIVREMERRRHVLLRAMGQPDSRGKRVLVIAVRDRGERAVYLPLDYIGVAWGTDNLTGRPGILLAANDNDREHVIDHEMAHVISFDIIADQPAWLSEGIATYFEMIDVFSDDTTVEIGRPRADRGRFLKQSPPLPIASLFACDDDDCGSGLFYATSWAVVSFLLNERYDQFVHYLEKLDELGRTWPSRPWYEQLRESTPEQRRHRRDELRAREADVWQAAFPDLPPDRLGKLLREWLVSGKARLPRIKVTLPQLRVTERKLSDAEVLAARSWLRLHFTSDRAAARGEAQTAIALDRTNVLARLVEAGLGQSIAPDDAQATAAAHPDDWRALRLVEFAHHGTAKGDAALERLCAMAGRAASECRGRPQVATEQR